MPDQGKPAIDVVITCYNEGKYITAAVDSVLKQTRADLIEQIIIVDDGSDDDTVSVLNRVSEKDSRIRVIYGPGGRGLPAQRNLAIGMGSAPWIAILDGDDIWATNKIELQWPLTLRPDVGLIYSDYYVFPDGDVNLANRAGVLDICDSQRLVEEYFLNDPPIIPSTTLIRREFFTQVDGFNSQVRVFEDTDFYLRLFRVCAADVVNEPLLFKRNRNTSITGGGRDLMLHHAMVAFKAGEREPTLLPLVPIRLSERARKLGNQKYIGGDLKAAASFLRLAVRLNLCNVRAWSSLCAVIFCPRLARRLLARQLKRRRAALGLIS